MFSEAYNRIIRNAICTNLFVMANIIVFVVMELQGSTLDTKYMVNSGASLSILVIDYGQYYRLFTSMFLHFGVGHLFNNMLALFFLGNNLEKAVGKVRFVLIYLLSGLGGSVLSCIYNYMNEEIVVSAGASGAVFGVIGALFYVVLINKGKLEDMTFNRMALLVIFSLYHGFSESGIDNMAHIGGFLCGVFFALLLYRRKKHSCCFDSDIIQ